MKIQIASDLHLEGCPGHLPDAAAFRSVPDRDLLILAGDIGVNLLGWAFIRRELEVSPVVYVPGNHEYYGQWVKREDVDAGWRDLAKRHSNLHFLVGEGVDIDGLRIWGAPWYSDLWGIRNHWREGSEVHREVAWMINDFHRGREWTLERHISQHRAETALLAAKAGQVDVVVTHWPPTKGAIHPKFEGDLINPYFINDKPDFVREVGASLWVSGHTHEAYDYMEGGTRCIGNPTGYVGEDRQSRLFRPGKAVELP